MREAWVVYSEAQQLFDLRPLEPSATRIEPRRTCWCSGTPEAASSPATQFAIDQPAARRPHPSKFVDPLAEADMLPGADAGNPMAAMGAEKGVLHCAMALMARSRIPRSYTKLLFRGGSCRFQCTPLQWRSNALYGYPRIYSVSVKEIEQDLDGLLHFTLH